MDAQYWFDTGLVMKWLEANRQAGLAPVGPERKELIQPG
jgi:hypothetical protein